MMSYKIKLLEENKNEHLSLDLQHDSSFLEKVVRQAET